VDWDQASATFVIGSVGAFFHGNLQPGEIDCLTAGTGKVVSIIVDSVIGFVEAVETAVGATDLTTVAPIVDETTGGTAQTLADLEQEEAEKESKGQVKERLLAKHHYYFPVTEAPFHLNGVVASVPKVFEALGKIARTVRNLTTACLQPDMEEQFDVAKKSLADGHMIGKQILVHGADIAEELDDAVSYVEEQNFSESGRCIGQALRRIVLQTSRLPPEGAPGKDEVAAMTGGLITGLLGGPTLVASEDGNPANWTLNFTACVIGAKAGFTHLWLDLWGNFSHLAADPSPHGTLSPKLWQGWMSDFLLHAPLLLQSCGLSLEVIDMLNDGASAVGKLHLNLSMETHRVAWEDVHDSLHRAVHVFKDNDWQAFGTYLGRAVQDFLLYLLPHAYGKTPSGILQRYSTQAGPTANSSFSAVLIMLGVVGVCLVAATFVLRRVRLQERAHAAVDLEGVPLVEQEALE